jgi:hypothetical protein
MKMKTIRGSSAIVVLSFAAVVLLVIGVVYYVTKPTSPLDSNAANKGNKYGLSKAPEQVGERGPRMSISPKPSEIENSDDLDKTEQDLDTTDVNQTDSEVIQVSNSL